MGKSVAHPSHGRLSPLVRGMIFGMHRAGSTVAEIVDDVVKPDGSAPSRTAVYGAIALCQKRGVGGWDGEPRRASHRGKPRATAPGFDKKIVALVFKHRGKAIVTAAFVRKKIVAARALSVRTVQRRICAAGLLWMRRRRKTLVLAKHKEARMAWSRWVLKRRPATLSQWAYTDGTVFYLARSEGEKMDGRRAALGPMVWRMANGSDALFEDCVGPSQYSKGQGQPVRLWGLLAKGTLFVTVLPAKITMNRWEYEKVIQRRFPKWIRAAFGPRAAPFLVQDHERCLWTAEPRAAMLQQGIKLLVNYPKCSQDINPIEEAWRELRARLAQTDTTHLEGREEFTVRLRAGVAWVNRNRRRLFKKICSSQKNWAQDVLDAEGRRTDH